MKKFYLAYGSNLNVAQMAHRCPTAKLYGSAVIDGYELLFKGHRNCACLTIEPNEKSEVPVGVWLVEEEDESRLDIYEGYPSLYYKKEMKLPIVNYADGSTSVETAFVYIMREDRPHGRPSARYLGCCFQGYDDFDFNPHYLMQAYDKSREMTR